VTLPWYVAALGAAVVWGIHYPLLDYALKRLSPVTALLLVAVPFVLLVPFFVSTLSRDATRFMALSILERATIAVLPLTSLVGSYLLFVAIQSKNATLASLIEITYPLFVAFFAWMLFGHKPLSLPIAAGALLIFAGVFLIIGNHS
jgi:drug/metabolite transporter (DMT)-like permease